GGGTFTLTGANTLYTGKVQINGGAVSVGADNNLGANTGSNTTIGLDSGTLIMTGPLSGNRKISLSGAGGTVDTGSFTGQFSEVDPGNFTKNGVGTMHVNRVNANLLTINN